MRFTKVVLLTFFIVSCGSSGKSAPDAGIATSTEVERETFPNVPIDSAGPAPDSFTIDADNRSYLGLPEKCGGNPVGTWSIEKIDLPGMIEALVGYIDKERLDACAPKFTNTGSGTAVFRPDGTFSISASIDMTFSMTAACVTESYGYDCREVVNCSPDNVGRCNCIGMPDGDKTVKYSLEGRYAAGHGMLMLVYPRPTEDSLIPSSTLFARTQAWKQSVLSTYCEKDGAAVFAVSGLPGGVDYYPWISRTVMYGLRQASVGGEAPAFVEGPDSPKPVPAPKSIAPSHSSSPWCKSSPVGKWSLNALSVDASLQEDLIREVREIYPDGECVSAIALSASGSVEFGPEGQSPNFSSDEVLMLAVNYQTACLEAKTHTCESVNAALKSQAEKLDRLPYVCREEPGACVCERVQQKTFASATYLTADAGPTSRGYWLMSPVDAGTEDMYAAGYCVNAKGLSIDTDFDIDGFSGDILLTAVPAK